MEDLLAKIYHSVISVEKESNNLGEVYDNKIREIITQYKENMTEEEVDKLQEILYDMAYVTEQGGFILGVRFMASLMKEVMANEIQIIDNSQS